MSGIDGNKEDWKDTIEPKTKPVMGNNEGSVQDTLNQRGTVYGNYGNVCKSRVAIMKVLYQHHVNVNGKAMDEKTAMGFSDVVLKLVRAAGKPDYDDSWHDLAGYATLMEEEANLAKDS